MVHKMERVKLEPLDSVDSQESIEMEDYSDDEDEVFVRNIRTEDSNDKTEASRPLMRRKKKVSLIHNQILRQLTTSGSIPETDKW